MSRHIKRLATPRTWTVPKKVAKWATKSRAGPHPADRSMPLNIVLRDGLGLADTARESRRILSLEHVAVDGRTVRDIKFPVGLQDIISLQQAGTAYRVLLDVKGRLALVEVPDAAAGWKLCRIEGKTTVKGGRTQLNLHDGRNLLVKEDTYTTGDVLKLKLPDQDIAAHYPFKEGAPALVTGGAHVGELVTVRGRTVVRGSGPNLVQLEGADEFETIEDYVFIVGDSEPEIQIPEEVIA